MSSPTTHQRSPLRTAATVAEGGGSKARSVQGSPRQLHLCKELFFAGFPCQQPYQHSTTSTAAVSSSPSTDSTLSKNTDVRPLSKKFVRGFFQQYGAVEALFYDEARGMGSVVFADGADAQGCYVAVHLSFLPSTTADGGIGQPTWETDKEGEDLAERRARAKDLLLCMEFAHCCPFVHPILLTKDVFVDGGNAYCEVPGGELSRAVLFHRFPQLLFGPSPSQSQPVAPHIVVSWQDGKEAEMDFQASRGEQNSTSKESRVEVIEGDDDAKNSKDQQQQKKPERRVTQTRPHFPGRGIEPVEIEEALWRLLSPAHVPHTPGNAVTVLDLWWVYYNLYMLHKTQPAESRIAEKAFRFAQRPSLAQELLEVQRQGREYAYGDTGAAQQVLQRLVYDHQYHNILTYLSVKEKFKYDPVYASLMRDLYRPKLVLQLEAWRTLVEEKASRKEAGAEAGEGTAAAASDGEVHRRRVVLKAMKELLEPKPTKPRDVEWVRRAEQTWLTLPRTAATANVMENVQFLRKVRRGEVDRNGADKHLSEVKPQPPPSTQKRKGGGMDGKENSENIADAYPSMSTRQKDEQFYAEVMQNLDGYVATGTAEELVALCEDPKVFRYAKGHIGYEEAHRKPSYWLAYLNALWVPLLALLLLGFGAYYIVDRLGIQKVNEMKQREQQQREFHDQLRHLLEQQQRIMNTSLAPSNSHDVRAAMRKMNETVRKASEAARKAGRKFNIELRGDL